MGYVALRTPIYNPLFMGKISAYLRHVCMSCRLLIEKHKVRCDNCGMALSEKRYTNVDMPTMQALGKQQRPSTKTIVHPALARDVLTHLGSELSNAIIDDIVVPPKLLRMADRSSRRETRISRLYGSLIVAVKRTYEEYTEVAVDDVYKRYQAVLEKPDDTDAQGSIIGMLSGKCGIFREMMVGRRVNTCGRSVIVGNDRIPPHEVGVPSVICENILVSLSVTKDNISHVRDMVSQGMLRHPDKRDTTRPIVSDVRVGKRFSREMSDGDIVMFNRQPSLTKHSMMSMVVRRISGRSIAMNTCLTPAYGADFDGDEMNVFFQDKLSSMSEQHVLMRPSNNILSDSDGSPRIHPVQDVITHTYILTRNNVEVPKTLYMDCCFSCASSVNGSREQYTTYDLVSVAFPSMLSYDSHQVVITNGRLVSGCIDRRVLLDVIRVISIALGGDESLSFIHRLQTIIHMWSLCRSPVSVGLSDILAHRTAVDIESIMRDMHHEDLSEEDYVRIADNTRATVEHEGTSRRTGSALESIVLSGAKGSTTNIMHLSSMIGQQYVLGRRPRMATERMSENIVGVMEGRGFCRSSYLTGMTPREYLFSQMSGREGVVRTNISTASEGYMSRRISKSLSSVKVSYDGIISDSTRILQLPHCNIVDRSKVSGGSLVSNDVLATISNSV
jgi:DNA-directed RNA polymerase beta' subunit